MSDKNEYWKEIFGDDFSSDLADELGISGITGDGDDGESFQIDESYFVPESEFQEKKSEVNDTNVIPPEVRDVAAYTSAKRPAVSGSEQQESFDLGSLDSIENEEDDEAEDGEAEDGEAEDDDRAVRFTRRRRLGCLGGLMYAAFILGAGVILACVAWMAADDVLALTKEDIVAEIEVPEDYEISDIADDLYAEGLIQYKFLFNWFCGIYDAEEKIQPGLYQVAAVDYQAMIKSMNQSSGEMVEVTVLIPEGTTLDKVFTILEDNGVSTVELLEEAAAYGEFEHDFLADLPTGEASRLEGYLFPDTYTFYKNQSAEGVLNKMLDNFDYRMEEYGVYEALAESSLTLHEAVIIGSMIEKEYASTDEIGNSEMGKISSVIHNRLAADMNLEIDATIQYILDDTKEVLTAADLAIDSPYNTRLYGGLPPGAICNPGAATVLAALQPDATDYYYYALGLDMTHQFFSSYDAHTAFVNSEEYYYYDDQQ